MTDDGDCNYKRTVTTKYLAYCLKRNWIDEHRLFLLDCRTQDERQRCRLIGSVNAKLVPSILFKRIPNGIKSLCNVILSTNDAMQFQKFYKTALVILIENDNDAKSEFTRILYGKLSQLSCDAAFFDGGVAQFRNQYPEFCSSISSDEASLAETESNSRCFSSLLRISGVSNMRLDDLDCINAVSTSSCHNEPITLTSLEQTSSADGSSNPSAESVVQYCENQNSKAHLYNCRFPVLIIPYLYLGNAENASDLNTLQKNGIKYILNVTPDLPNTFEDDENFKYMQIPVDDHWSQNLTEYFPRAFEFIDEGRRQGVGVLVHCWAGISRSVTVTVAYLMRTLNLSMEDAYDHVKSHKPNIAPNFNFMGQLLDYERDLYGDNTPVCQRSPDDAPPTASVQNDEDKTDYLVPEPETSSATYY